MADGEIPEGFALVARCQEKPQANSEKERIVRSGLREASGAEFELIVAESSLFGPTITTAGLLVGRDRYVGRTPAARFDPEVDMFTTSPSSSTAVSPSHGGCQNPSPFVVRTMR